MSITAFTLFALTLSVPAAPADAPLALHSRDGLELVNDEQVFVLFAALNGAGYAEETRRRGPPLRAPLFHPLRESVRDELRKVREQASMVELTRLFESNPAEVETYLEAALAADDRGPLSPEAAKLRPVLAPALAKLAEEAQLGRLFDGLAVQQRELARALAGSLEKDLAEARKVLGDAELRAPLSLVVVPNPLDADASVRRLRQGDREVLVVGANVEVARRAVLEACLRPALLDMTRAAGAAPSAKRVAAAWDAVKSTRRIVARWSTPEAYLADALTSAVSQRARAAVDGKASKEAEEEHAEADAQEQQRWTRGAYRVLDGLAPGQALKAELPRLLGKSSL